MVLLNSLARVRANFVLLDFERSQILSVFALTRARATVGICTVLARV